MGAFQRVQALREKDPGIPASEIARKVGVSREYVRQCLTTLGLPTRTERSYRREEAAGENRAPSRRFGIKLTSHTIGAISEMVVVTELLTRGLDVFRAVSPHAICDLVAVDRASGRLLRIEVRSGKHNVNGHIACSRPADRSQYDTIAIVFSDGTIHFSPPIDDFLSRK